MKIALSLSNLFIKRSLIFSSIFIVACQTLNQTNLNDKSVLRIGNEDAYSICAGSVLMLTGVNGDTKDSKARYKVGSLLELAPGATEFLYSCLHFSHMAQGECLFEITPQYSAIKYILESDSEYLLECTKSGDIQLLKKIQPSE